MKKTALISAVCALFAAGTAFAADYRDGTYVGNGQGKGGRVKVQVVIDGGKIADVKVLRHADTEAIFAAAQASVPAAIVEKNSTDVEAVGGATLSSEGIIAGVKDALGKAK